MKKKLKSLFIAIGLSTAIVTPIVLTSCTKEVANNSQNGSNNSQKPDNNGDQNQGGNNNQKPGENEQNKKYSIAIDNDHKSEITLDKTEAIENEEVTVTLSDSINPTITKFFYTINNFRVKQEITTTGKVGKFKMPKGNVSIDVETKFKLSFKSINSSGQPIDAGIIKINDQDIKEKEFLDGEKVKISFVPKNEFILEKIEINNNSISINKDTTEITMPKNNVEITLIFKAKTTAVIKDIFMSTLKSFDVWDFLPEKFNSKNREFINFEQKEFSNNFINKNDIQTNGVGKQFDQVFTVFSAVNAVIKGADLIFNSANKIADLYQKYINENGINKEYESTTDNIKFKISYDGNKLRILAKISGCSLEIASDNSGSHYGRIQITNANAIKFEISNSSVKFGLKAFGTERMMVEMDKTIANKTIVKIYNFIGKINSNTEDSEDQDSKLGIKTTSVIYFDNEYLSIMGKKGDFFSLSPKNRNMEVYDIKTGEFVTSKVYEKGVGKYEYLTNWYPLKYINGINSIKQDVKENKPTSDFFLNNNTSSVFKDKKISLTNPSRMYDLEMKDSIIYGKKNSNDKDKVDLKIPMLFIQNEFDNANGFKNINDQNKTIKLTVSSIFDESLKNKISNYYTSIKNNYDSFEEWMTANKVTDYVGIQDTWLDKKD